MALYDIKEIEAIGKLIAPKEDTSADLLLKEIFAAIDNAKPCSEKPYARRLVARGYQNYVEKYKVDASRKQPSPAPQSKKP